MASPRLRCRLHLAFPSERASEKGAAAIHFCPAASPVAAAAATALAEIRHIAAAAWKIAVPGKLTEEAAAGSSGPDRTKPGAAASSSHTPCRLLRALLFISAIVTDCFLLAILPLKLTKKVLDFPLLELRDCRPPLCSRI